jgi:hypothetical protein
MQMLREAGHDAGDIDNEQHAALALGLIVPDTSGADEVVAALVSVLNSKSADSRAAALKALPRFGPMASVAVATIRPLCQDRDALVKQLAAKALAELDQKAKP